MLSAPLVFFLFWVRFWVKAGKPASEFAPDRNNRENHPPMGKALAR